jgi:hypothetical protein
LFIIAVSIILDFYSGNSDAFDLLDEVEAFENLGVTEGTLAES